MRWSVPTTNRSMWVGYLATAAIEGLGAATPPATWNQLAQPPLTSHQVLKIPWFEPTAQRSMCFGSRVGAVKDLPGAAAPPLTLNQLAAQPPLASHQIL